MQSLLLAAALAVATAQQNSPDPVKDFCRRHQHQTCIIDSILYIDGGKVFYGGSVEEDSVAEQNTVLLWEDVRDTDNPNMFPPQHTNLTKDPNVPSTSGGVLWPDTTNKLFYLFGGEYDTVTEVQDFDSLWFFDVIYNTWNKSSASDTSRAGISWPAFGAGAMSDAGVAYYYGGYLNNKTVPKWGSESLMLNSLTSYDMNTGTWFNRTYDATPRAEGILHYLPASAAGMLVYFGGVEMNSSGGLSFADMSQIHLFEINDNKWYTQKASGEVPAPRRGACAGVVWAADRTSYNFYVLGGIGENGDGFDEAFILTLPSFQWKRIYPSPPAPFPNQPGKGWYSCDVIRDSQLLTIGGVVTNSSIRDCDVPNLSGQHGLLMGQESVEEGHLWHAVLNETNGYRVPDQIVELVGGDADGHATRTTPVQGWSSPTFSGFWKGTNIPKSRTATRFGTETPTADQPTSLSEPSNTNVGAIAGGTVGGVVALAGVIAIAFFCLRRRRKQATHGRPGIHPNGGADPHGPTMIQKQVPHDTVSQGSTMLHHSPQGSQGDHGWQREQHYYQVSPQSQNQYGEWTQPANYAYQQPYYQQPSGPHEIDGMIPDARNPTVELPDVKSPVGGPGELPEMYHRVPATELK